MDISVLGCGWLGFPLAVRLQEAGFNVKGSTSTKKKLSVIKQNEIAPYLIDLPDSFDDPEIETFWDTELLFLNIPPKVRQGKGGESFLKIIEKVIAKAKEKPMNWIIFVSSTSVYPESGSLLKEEDTDKDNTSRPAGKVLLEAENLLRNSGINSTILRPGGLYGYGRHPVHYLSGRKNLGGASKPVHLIHQVDCLNIIMKIIELQKASTVYNMVSDGHPPKKEFYKSAAKYYDLPAPHFSEDHKTGYPIISNEKVKRELSYSFNYPNPMDHTP
jgi:nucleoside-diphosphate-sugar epimerase